MPQSYVTTQGTLIVPGSYPSYTVRQAASGLSTSGVVMLVGEADAGPDFASETDLSQNFFGPGEANDVVAKYKTGPLVDAFRAVVVPMNDPEIQGAPSRIYIVKTNASDKASSAITAWGGGAYGTLYDQSHGQLGNLIYYTITAGASEVAPTTAPFTWLQNISDTDLEVRVNGDAVQALTIDALSSPALVAEQFCGLDGVAAAGGLNRQVVDAAIAAGSDTLAADATGNSVVFTISTSWANNPTVGDTLYVSSTSVVKGSGSENVGSYVITAVTDTTITATKLCDASGASGALTSPADVAAADMASEAADILCYSPITIQVGAAATPLIDSDDVGSATLTVGTVSGKTAVFTISTTWLTQPAAGDILFIGPDSAIKGGSSVNVGSWVVTGSTSSTANVTKISNATAGACTSPAAVTATATADLFADLMNLGQTLTGGDPVDGIGKTLEINELTTGTDLLSDYAYRLNTSKVTWVSTSAVPALMVSATEYSAKLTENRQFDSISNSVTGGGEIALKIGYTGTTAQVDIGTPDADGNPTVMTITRSGGAGADIGAIQLSQFPTLADLAAFINSKLGYSCAVGTVALGQLPSKALDIGTFTFGSDFGTLTGRLKADAYRWFQKVQQGAALVQFGNPALRATAGLPEPQPSTGATYLAGGSRGATTNTIMSDAFDACKRLRGNFLVPLFSADAADDITAALTDSNSDYEIDTINALAKTHALACSTMKARRNRQCFLSKQATYPDQKEAAANLASFRCSMTFQDCKEFSVQPDGSSTIVQFQPWMTAVKAAGGQAAAFYKALVHKTPNISGYIHPEGTNAPDGFDDQDQDKLEDALLSGLLPLSKDDQGVPFWVSDQTTYVKDNNFVYNSIQAVYSADLISLTTAKRMEDSFVGQSVADVSAAVALSTMESIMKDMIRLKLLAPSDDAPLGFKDLVIKIAGPAMIVSISIRLAGAIYFIPISFLVSQVTQSASSQ